MRLTPKQRAVLWSLYSPDDEPMECDASPRVLRPLRDAGLVDVLEEGDDMEAVCRLTPAARAVLGVDAALASRPRGDLAKVRLAVATVFGPSVTVHAKRGYTLPQPDEGEADYSDAIAVIEWRKSDALEDWSDPLFEAASRLANALGVDGDFGPVFSEWVVFFREEI